MRIKPDPFEADRIFEFYRKSFNLHSERGTLELIELPVIIARRAILFDLHHELYSVVGRTANLLIKRVSIPYGRDFCKWVKNTYFKGKEFSTEIALKFLACETLAIGMGKIIIQYDKDSGEVLVEGPDGLPVGRKYIKEKIKVDSSVDSYHLGYYEGFMSELFNTKYVGVEETCVALGASSCIARLMKKE